jgi:hypothetical protein
VKNSSEGAVGGLVGVNFNLIVDSFARNRIAAGRGNLGPSTFGGLVGKNDVSGQIKTSYAAGEMSFKTSGRAGGLIGTDAATSGSIANSYWDLDMGIGDPHRGAGNVKDDPGITGLTTEQFQSGLPQGFDPKMWAIDPKNNNGSPYLLANPPAK